MPSEFDTLLGKRLRSRRLQLRMTQKVLGQQLGVTPQLVHKWESAQSALYAEQLYLLGQALQVDPVYFYEGFEAVPMERLPAED